MLARAIFVAVMMSIALACLLVTNDYVGEVVGEYLVRDDRLITVDPDNIDQTSPFILQLLQQPSYRVGPMLLACRMLEFASYLLISFFCILPPPPPQPMLAVSALLALLLAALIIQRKMQKEMTELREQLESLH